MGAPSHPTQDTKGNTASRTILLDHTEAGEDVTLDCTSTAGTSDSAEILRSPQPGDELRARYSYRVLRRLGRGGFGSVFLARCLDNDDCGDETAPPRLVALTMSFSLEATSTARASPPATRNERIPPKAFICLFAIACPGWDVSPG